MENRKKEHKKRESPVKRLPSRKLMSIAFYIIAVLLMSLFLLCFISPQAEAQSYTIQLSPEDLENKAYTYSPCISPAENEFIRFETGYPNANQQYPEWIKFKVWLDSGSGLRWRVFSPGESHSDDIPWEKDGAEDWFWKDYHDIWTGHYSDCWLLEIDNQNWNGNIKAHIKITVTDWPGKPSNLQANSDKYSIDLSWSAPTDKGGGINNYYIDRGTSPSNLAPYRYVSGSDHDFVDRDVEAGVTYYYQIYAKSNGGKSTTTQAASATVTPFVEVTQPDGGENWKAGSSHSISWNSNIGGSVDIYLMEGSSYVDFIADDTTNDGTYYWSIPRKLENSDSYRVKIVSSSDSSVYDYSDDYFNTFGADYIEVTTPNDGERYQRGETYSIQWDTNIGGVVDIELYKQGNYDHTIASDTSNDGYYSWTIPSDQKADNDYEIKITSFAYDLCDYSDSYFTIANDYIEVTQPNGGESWGTGTDHYIRWSSSSGAGTYVNIYLKKAGSQSSTIATDTYNDGRYYWTVPNSLEINSDYKIKIVSAQDYSIADDSDSYFSVYKDKYIRVTQPNGDESWKQGTSHQIKWESNDDGNIEVELYKQGSYDHTIASDTSNDGYYSWNVPLGQEVDDDYKIKIVSASDSSLYDYGDSVFTIDREAYIKVTQPDGGESWQKGTSHSIKWNSNAGGRVKIELYVYGNSERTITSSTSNDGSYSWTVPSDLNIIGDYKVKITSTSDGSIYDYTDASFSVTEGHNPDTTPPSIIIIDGPSGTIDASEAYFEWTGEDDKTSVDDLVYSYKLEGHETDWSSWLSSTDEKYTNLPIGQYIFKVKAKDEADNVADPATRSFVVEVNSDDSPPQTSYIFSPAVATGEKGWYVNEVEVSLEAHDNDSGVNATHFKINNEEWEQYTSPFLVSREGKIMISYYSIDSAGNTEILKNTTLKVDKNAPRTAKELHPVQGSGNEWHHEEVTVILNGTDNASGLEATYYSIDGKEWHMYTDAFDIENEGIHTIYYYSVDQAGNEEPPRNVTLKIDKKAPTTQHSLHASTPSPNRWYRNGVDITLNVDEDVSGVKNTFYRIDDGSWKIYGGQITLSADGSHTLQYYSTDKAGNQEEHQNVTINIDAANPSISLSQPTGQYLYMFDRPIMPLLSVPLIVGDITVKALASDTLSGIEKVEFYVDGKLQYTDEDGPFQWRYDKGTKLFYACKIEVVAYDAAGNTAREGKEAWMFGL